MYAEVIVSDDASMEIIIAKPRLYAPRKLMLYRDLIILCIYIIEWIN